MALKWMNLVCITEIFKKELLILTKKLRDLLKSGEQNLIIFREYLAEISEKIDRAHKGSGT